MALCDNYPPAEELYLGHDNAVTIIPYADIITRRNYDMSAVTEVTATADLLTSVTSGDAISASTGDAPVTMWFDQDAVDGTIWYIHLRVGLFVGIAAGEYKVRVVLIEPSNPNGLVVADDLLVTVIDTP